MLVMRATLVERQRQLLLMLVTFDVLLCLDSKQQVGKFMEVGYAVFVLG